MKRRVFIKKTLLTGSALWLSSFRNLFAKGMFSDEVGEKWEGGKKGQFQVHFIYTGAGESMFYIFPDGTSMLLDCGDFNAGARGKLAVPILPNAERHAGEWIARYVERVNPHGKEVDYMMLSHYHNDHSGDHRFFVKEEERDGKPYQLSGFALAAEYLHFGKAFDRAYPTYDDPIDATRFSSNGLRLIKRFYEYQTKNNNLIVERFQVGANNQVCMLYSPHDYSNFNIFNVCGNGRIASADGTIHDLYKGMIDKNTTGSLDENAMSLGMVISYGPFRFFTAGDFYGSYTSLDGKKVGLEDEIASVLPPCHVSKVNHHGHNAMTKKIIQALRSKVYVSCVWDQLHNLDATMKRLSDRTIYPGDRYLCPTIMPEERRQTDGDKEWMKDVVPDTFTGCHVILNVDKRGKRYSISFISAEDEEMIVKSVLKFRTKEPPSI